jgi:hypothetical protein
MNSSTLYNINDPYKAYCLSVNHYLSVREESNSMPSSTRRPSFSRKLQYMPKLSLFDTLQQSLPAWAYGVLLGLGCLVGIALAIVSFGFAFSFIIVHGSSLF